MGRGVNQRHGSFARDRGGEATTESMGIECFMLMFLGTGTQGNMDEV